MRPVVPWHYRAANIDGDYLINNRRRIIVEDWGHPTHPCRHLFHSRIYQLYTLARQRDVYHAPEQRTSQYQESSQR